MDFKPKPQIIKPFPEFVVNDLQKHVAEVRRLFDWPGIPYHDANDHEKFNRWCWHNLPLLTYLHHGSDFINLASNLAGQPLKPSYNFLSMYGPEGVCPPHVDRPQCQFTIDLQIDADCEWPIYIEEKPYKLKNGEGLFYSGTGQVHYRKAMSEDSDATKVDLAFFHFVPVSWAGRLS